MKFYLVSNEATFKQLSLHQTVADMDESIKEHKRNHSLSKGEIDVIEVLARHSCKYPGVSFLTNKKIGQIVDKRRETVSRIRKKLERKGIIVQYALKRESGDCRETGSAAVFQPIQQTDRQPTGEQESSEVTPGHHTGTSHQETSFINYLKPNTHIRDGEGVKPSPDQLSKRALKTSIPKAIYDAITPFFDAKGVYETYGILLRAKSKGDQTIMIEDDEQAYVDTFYNVIRKYKLGEVSNLRGLLFVAWQKITSEISRKKHAEKANLFPDVLKQF